MIFDVNQTIASIDNLLPWELVVRLDGVDFPTRAPTVGELMIFESLAKAGTAVNVLNGMFTVDRPAIESWSIEQVEALMLAVVTAFGEHVKKNSRAIAGATAQAMGKSQSP